MTRLPWLRSLRGALRVKRRQQVQYNSGLDRCTQAVEALEERVLLSAAADLQNQAVHAAWREMSFSVDPQQAVFQVDVGPAVDSQHPEVADAQATSLIGLPTVFASTTYRGGGYSVAVIDTGVDYNHPNLGGGWGNRVVAGWDFVNDDSDPMDDHGHGTHVAGIIGSNHATYTGIAPDVNIVALKVLGANGSGSFGDVEDALQWVALNADAYNIVAVNLSLGAGNFTANPYTFLDDEFSTLEDDGVFVAVSSGNSFFSYGSEHGVGAPAISSYTVSVGAVWDANVGSVSWSSGAQDHSTGPDRITSFTQRGDMLDIVAPGALLTNTYVGGGFATLGGTSMAAPVVAGAAALLRQAADDTGQLEYANQDALLALMQDTGVTIVDGDDEDDNVTNTGLSFQRLDLAAAVDALLAAANEAPAMEPLADQALYNYEQAHEMTLAVSDADGDDVTITTDLDVAPGEDPGIVAVDGDTVTYTPAAGYTGTFDLTFTADDGTESTSQTITISVHAPKIAAGFDAPTGELAATLLEQATVEVTESAGLVEVRVDGIVDGSVSGLAAIGVLSIDITGSDGNDHVDLSAVNETTFKNISSASVDGGNGDDTLVGSDANDSLSGKAGNDQLDGRDGDDWLNGAAGDDLLIGGGGDDRMFGGSGNDQLDGGDGHDFLKGQSGNDAVDGSGGDDSIYGGNDHDTLAGGAGDDALDGQSGNDILQGGDGHDSLIGGNGRDGLTGGAGDDFLNGCKGYDTLVGDEGNDSLFGGAAKDLLLGGEGDDNLNGQGGLKDTLAGGNGTNSLNMSDESDIVDESFVFAAEWLDVA